MVRTKPNTETETALSLLGHLIDFSGQPHLLHCEGSPGGEGGGGEGGGGGGAHWHGGEV